MICRFNLQSPCHLLSKAPLWELRTGSSVPRVVRVGTHGLKKGSTSTLWGRLRAHRGTSTGGGNHRGSVFRRHVGLAIKESGANVTEAPQWGKGSSASKAVRDSEKLLEKQVSEYIGSMQLLWIAVEDEPGPESDRAFIEKNAIALLSGNGSKVDPASSDWLGRQSSHQLISTTGLWNVNFVGGSYDSRFLEVFEAYVLSTIQEND